MLVLQPDWEFATNRSSCHRAIELAIVCARSYVETKNPLQSKVCRCKR